MASRKYLFILVDSRINLFDKILTHLTLLATIRISLFIENVKIAHLF